MLKRIFGNSDRTGSVGWLIAETVVVVAGILIAFQLESWREDWNDRKEEIVAVRAILDDLDADDWELEMFIESASRQEQAFRKLALHFDNGPQLSEAELVQMVWDAVLFRNWQPSAPTYEGLRDTGKLDLISDQALRNELSSQFDGWEVYPGVLADNNRQATMSFQEVAQADFYQSPRSEEDGAQFVWKLSTPMNQLPSHPQFRGRLGRAGSYARWVVIRMTEGLEHNEELRQKLKAHLERIGPGAEE